MFNRLVKGVGLTALALLVAAIGVWGALLLEYAGPRSDLSRTVVAVGGLDRSSAGEGLDDEVNGLLEQIADRRPAVQAAPEETREETT